MLKWESLNRLSRFCYCEAWGRPHIRLSCLDLRYCLLELIPGHAVVSLVHLISLVQLRTTQNKAVQAKNPKLQRMMYWVQNLERLAMAARRGLRHSRVDIVSSTSKCQRISQEYRFSVRRMRSDSIAMQGYHG